MDHTFSSQSLNEMFLRVRCRPLSQNHCTGDEGVLAKKQIPGPCPSIPSVRIFGVGEDESTQVLFFFFWNAPVQWSHPPDCNLTSLVWGTSSWLSHPGGSGAAQAENPRLGQWFPNYSKHCKHPENFKNSWCLCAPHWDWDFMGLGCDPGAWKVSQVIPGADKLGNPWVKVPYLSTLCKQFLCMLSLEGLTSGRRALIH